MSDENELRDTGKNRKIVDEKDHMSNARAFDTLVTSNLQLVKTLRVAILVMALCGLIATGMTTMSAFTLRQGQSEIRDLIMALNRSRCSDIVPSKGLTP